MFGLSRQNFDLLGHASLIVCFAAFIGDWTGLMPKGPLHPIVLPVVIMAMAWTRNADQ